MGRGWGVIYRNLPGVVEVPCVHPYWCTFSVQQSVLGIYTVVPWRSWLIYKFCPIREIAKPFFFLAFGFVSLIFLFCVLLFLFLFPAFCRIVDIWQKFQDQSPQDRQGSLQSYQSPWMWCCLWLSVWPSVCSELRQRLILPEVGEWSRPCWALENDHYFKARKTRRRYLLLLILYQFQCSDRFLACLASSVRMVSEGDQQCSCIYTFRITCKILHVIFYIHYVMYYF